MDSLPSIFQYEKKKLSNQGSNSRISNLMQWKTQTISLVYCIVTELTLTSCFNSFSKLQSLPKLGHYFVLFWGVFSSLIIHKYEIKNKRGKLSIGYYRKWDGCPFHAKLTKKQIHQNELFMFDITIFVFVVKIPKYREKKNNTKTQNWEIHLYIWLPKFNSCEKDLRLRWPFAKVTP